MHHTIYGVFLDVTWLLHINVILYDHSLTDISEQMYSNLSMFWDRVNVQITWETSLHCHVIAPETNDRIKIKYQLTCQYSVLLNVQK